MVHNENIEPDKIDDMYIPIEMIGFNIRHALHSVLEHGFKVMDCDFNHSLWQLLVVHHKST